MPLTIALQDGEVQIVIETTLHLTESAEKVKRAISNIFPDAVFQAHKDGILRGTSHDLSKLKERLAAQAIRDASRRVLLRGIRPGHIYVMISKQAAFVNRVNFSEDGPLGDITVIIRTEQPETVVDHLTEKDQDQQPPGRIDGSRDKAKDGPSDEYLGHVGD